MWCVVECVVCGVWCVVECGGVWWCVVWHTELLEGWSSEQNEWGAHWPGQLVHCILNETMDGQSILSLISLLDRMRSGCFDLICLLPVAATWSRAGHFWEWAKTTSVQSRTIRFTILGSQFLLESYGFKPAAGICILVSQRGARTSPSYPAVTCLVPCSPEGLKCCIYWEMDTRCSLYLLAESDIGDFVCIRYAVTNLTRSFERRRAGIIAVTTLVGSAISNPWWFEAFLSSRWDGLSSLGLALWITRFHSVSSSSTLCHRFLPRRSPVLVLVSRRASLRSTCQWEPCLPTWLKNQQVFGISC